MWSKLHFFRNVLVFTFFLKFAEYIRCKFIELHGREKVSLSFIFLTYWISVLHWCRFLIKSSKEVSNSLTFFSWKNLNFVLRRGLLLAYVTWSKNCVVRYIHSFIHRYKINSRELKERVDISLTRFNPQWNEFFNRCRNNFS